MDTLMQKLVKRLVGLGCSLLLLASPAAADWTWNVGYHNPAGSTVGLNLLYLGQTFGFEAGLGWLDVRADSDDSKDDKVNSDDDKKTGGSFAAAGDVNLKYFFGSGTFRPYAQAGVGVGLGARTGSGAGASTGGGFAGLGLLIGSPSFYGYGAYNLDGSRNAFGQAGLGFDL